MSCLEDGTNDFASPEWHVNSVGDKMDCPFRHARQGVYLYSKMAGLI